MFDYTYFFDPSFAEAETVMYSCDYENYSNQKGTYNVDKKFELQFIIDRKIDKSYLLGNNGAAEVNFIESDSQVVFIEITPVGSIISTTIDKNLNSVHSRNSVLDGGLLPSQYYGKCLLK